MADATAIGLTLVVYQVALLGIGAASSRRTHDEADFFLGGRRLGPWVASLSASASSSSAWTLLGVSGAAYAWGLSALWIFPACVGGFWLNWSVLAPGLRRLARDEGALTVTDVLAGPGRGPGSRAIRGLATAIVLLSLWAYVAAQFQGAGKTFHETFGLDLGLAIVLGSAIVVAYTMLGGFWAASITDTVQGLVMAAASVLLPVAALVTVGGPARLGAAMESVAVPGYGSLLRNLGPAAATGFVLGILGIGLGYPGQPHVVNRFMAMRDEATVAAGRRIAIGWAVVMYAGMLVLGWCARVLYPGLGDPEVAFITATRELFSPVFAGVLLAAVLSAIMSTADSQLLVAASSVSHDLGLFGDRGARATVLRSRLTVLALSLGAIALALGGDPSIWGRVLFAWSAMGAAFGPLLLVRVLSGPVGTGTSLLAMGVGFVGSVIAYSRPELAGTAWERVAPFVAAGLVAIVGRRQRRESPR